MLYGEETKKRLKKRTKKLRTLALSAILTCAAAGAALSSTGHSSQTSEMISQSTITTGEISVSRTLSKDDLMRQNGTFYSIADSVFEEGFRDGFAESDAEPASFDSTYKKYKGLYRDTPGDKKSLEEIGARLSKSAEGKALLDSMSQWGVSMSLSDLGDDYDGLWGGKDSEHIWLSQDVESAALVSILAHEASHARQDRDDLTSHENMSLDESMALTRFYEADACAHAVLAAYQLQENGDSTAFELYKDTPMYGHIAQAVEEAADKQIDNKPLDDKTVLRTAFEAWFEDKELRDSYDLGTLTNNAHVILMQTQKATQAHFTDKTDFAERIQRLCVTTDGNVPYLDNPEKYLQKNSIYMGQFDPKVVGPGVNFLSKRLDDIQKPQTRLALKEVTPDKKRAAISGDKKDVRLGDKEYKTPQETEQNGDLPLMQMKKRTHLDR